MKLKTKVLALVAMGATLIFGSALTANADEWYQYTPAECSHKKRQEAAWEPGNDSNDWYYFNTFTKVGVNNPQANMCYLCGEECSHPEAYREYVDKNPYDSYIYEDGKHYRVYWCRYCNSKEGYANNGDMVLVDPGVPCTGEAKQDMPYPNQKPTHTVTCTTCNRRSTTECTLKASYEPYYYPEGTKISDTHNVDYVCTVCDGNYQYDWKNEAHTFKKNKCTKCKYKIIKPANTKVISAKQSGAAKIRSIKGGGYWQKTYVGSSGVKWKWIAPFTKTNKVYSIKLSLKKAKNAESYLVSTNKKFTGTTTQRFGKKTLTYNYVVKSSARPTKVKLYITTVSKTGTYGKTIAKTIKLSN